MPRHPSLAFNVRVDVAVMGGGVSGVTAAYLLKAAGRTVALVERGRCGLGETARTTAQVTAIPRRGLADLVDRLGPAGARSVWDAGFAALTRLRALVRDERINCEFAWVPSILYASAETPPIVAESRLRREAAAAETLDIDADFRDSWPGLPGAAVVFDGQARLHPLRYLSVLVNRLSDRGSHVFEETDVQSVQGDGPFELRSGDCRIVADHVVAATHEPPPMLVDAIGPDLPIELRAHTAHFVSGVADAGILGEGIYWEQTDDAQLCVRLDRRSDHDEVCAGLYDHHDGSDVDAFEAIGLRLRALVPGARLTHRWRGRLIESSDGLPFIGEVAPGRYVTTAHGGHGLTFGTLAGMLIADAICGRPNPWQPLFGAARALTSSLQRAGTTDPAAPAPFG